MQYEVSGYIKWARLGCMGRIYNFCDNFCRTMGIGMAVIAFFILISGIFENMLPASFVYVLIGVIIADVIIIVILSNTICKKR